MKTSKSSNCLRPFGNMSQRFEPWWQINVIDNSLICENWYREKTYKENKLDIYSFLVALKNGLTIETWACKHENSLNTTSETFWDGFYAGLLIYHTKNVWWVFNFGKKCQTYIYVGLLWPMGLIWILRLNISDCQPFLGYFEP